MMRLTYLFVVFFFITLATVNARSISQDSTDEQLVASRINAKKQLSGTMASYRHRFSHSPNFKKLKWTLNQQSNPPYCAFCHVFVPVVNLMYMYMFKFYYFCLRFEFSSKLIQQLMWKMLLLVYVKILQHTQHISIMMFVLEPYMNIR